MVETAGRWWVAQRVRRGVRNISNVLSIRTEFQRCAEGLQEHARAAGYWDGSAEFDWAAAFQDGGAPPRGCLTPGREAEGHKCAGALAPVPAAGRALLYAAAAEH